MGKRRAPGVGRPVDGRSSRTHGGDRVGYARALGWHGRVYVLYGC